MTDKEKIELKDGVINIFKRFNILDHTATIGELRDDIIRYINSLQEEPVNENFEEALAQEWKGYNDRGAATVDALEDNTQELAFAKGFYRGTKWQEKQDQETIELAEDHAMLAGMVKGTEHTIGNVRSILNKVAYENNGLDVNGDYCEQPYIELDNEFRKLLK